MPLEMKILHLLQPLCGQASPNPLAIDGFLPFGRGSLMLDVVFVAMFVIVPLLALSLWLVKFRRNYQLHKTTATGDGQRAPGGRGAV